MGFPTRNLGVVPSSLGAGPSPAHRRIGFDEYHAATAVHKPAFEQQGHVEDHEPRGAAGRNLVRERVETRFDALENAWVHHRLEGPALGGIGERHARRGLAVERTVVSAEPHTQRLLDAVNDLGITLHLARGRVGIDDLAVAPREEPGEGAFSGSDATGEADDEELRRFHLETVRKGAASRAAASLPNGRAAVSYERMGGRASAVSP